MNNFKNTFADAYTDVKSMLLSKPAYNVYDFYWDIQDCLKFQQNNRKEYTINDDMLNILKSISFEWEKKKPVYCFQNIFLKI